MRSASTLSITPSRFAIVVTPESRPTVHLQAGADQRRVGLEQRHRLALHVRTHQRAVRVVVFQKRNQRRGDRDQLVGRDVHVLDFFGADDGKFAADTRRDRVRW